MLPPEGIGATGLAHWIRKPLWTHDCKNMMKRSKSQFTSKKVCTVLIELCFFFQIHHASTLSLEEAYDLIKTKIHSGLS